MESYKTPSTETNTIKIGNNQVCPFRVTSIGSKNVLYGKRYYFLLYKSRMDIVDEKIWTRVQLHSAGVSSSSLKVKYYNNMVNR